MGFFDRSSTQRSSTNSNAALQTGEGSIGLNLSNVGGGGKYAKTDVNISMTDYGAVDRAFEAVDSVFEFAGGAVNRALDSSDAARVDSLMFGAGAVQAAFAEAESARQESSRIQQLALRQVQESQAQANAMVRENTAQSIGAVRASTVDAMQFSAGAFQSALGSIEENNDRSMGSVIDFSNEAIEFVAESTRSEASQSFDKLVQTAGYAVAAMAAVTLIPKLLAA
ncbi:MAG: hypothetical protein KZQ94_20920 [Candidatus Thiodiazotropha sp. (ex Troendleina suluensis)]|nr:hypothetical protein [Candidatus Thiodiazotropha sp. (ex Troendleina suluensis)]